MQILKSSTSDTVDYIKNGCKVWYDLVYEKLGLQTEMFLDIESLALEDESDLPPIRDFFISLVSEQLSAPSQTWSWRTRTAMGIERSAYLDWLQLQWDAGRWADDQTIRRESRQVLDPRYARYVSLIYFRGPNSLGNSWPDVVSRYRNLAEQEAILNFISANPNELNTLSKSSVEAYVNDYFANRNWRTRTCKTEHGNILTFERKFPDSDYVFRCSIDVADKSLLNHVDAWFCVIKNDTDPQIIGGPSALVASSVRQLLPPSSSYYLNHDKNKHRLMNAIRFVESTFQILTHCQ